MLVWGLSNQRLWCNGSTPFALCSEWQDDVSGYLTSNENKIAERMTSDEEDPTLYSKGSPYTCGQSIVFKVLESGAVPRRASTQIEEEEKIATEGVALTVAGDCASFLCAGIIFVSTDGKNSV